MPGIQIICFESNTARDFYQQLDSRNTPSEPKRFYYTLDEFVSELDGQKTLPNRLEILTARLPEEERPKAFSWLYTLEKLRESLILSHEDADFCFSVLPTTPRHKLLLQMLHAYLDSELKQDWTERIWQLRDRFRERSLALEENTEIAFIQSSPSNFLFPELADTLRTSLPHGKVTIAPSWASEESDGQVSFVRGSTTELAKSLAGEISGNEIIALQTSRATVCYFAAQLAKRGVRFRNWIFSSGTGVDSNANVHLIPLNLLPARGDGRTRIFVDETLFQPDREPLLLRENDLLLLEREGFTLPKLLDHRRQMKQILERAAKSANLTAIYSSFPDSTKLLAVPWSAPEALPVPTAQSEAPPTQGILLSSRRPLSATQLETYSKCPSQYLFSQVMRWRKKLSPQDQYALIFGQATHSALENFFREESGREQILRNPETAKTRLMELFRHALEQGENPVPSTSSSSVMWQQHFQRIYDRLPGMERQLADVFSTRRVVAVEKQFTLSVAGSQVTGKIDRIDEREDGSLLVLDYKTGTIDFTPDHISKGTHFQALLYVLGAERELGKPVAGMIFYDLKQGELKRGILREESFAKDVKKAVTRGHLLPATRWESVVGEGTASLERLALGISSGEFSATASAKNCQYCDFAAMCRKAVGYA